MFQQRVVAKSGSRFSVLAAGLGCHGASDRFALMDDGKASQQSPWPSNNPTRGGKGRGWEMRAKTVAGHWKLTRYIFMNKGRYA